MPLVSFNAVLKRLNRKLRKEGEVVRAVRGSVYGFHHVDVDANALISEHVGPDTIEAWARERGLLHAGEQVAALERERPRVPTSVPTGTRRSRNSVERPEAVSPSIAA
jgi:hypothetical protein